MLVLVCGSRDWDRRRTIHFRLALLPQGTTILHGCAPGADSIAEDEAWKLGYDVRGEPAEWNKYGKSAGIRRNLKMLDMEPDLVIAFQKNRSRGTQHTIDEATKRGIPLEVYYDGG